VLALEPLRGLRVVADPAAVDGARWTSQGASVTVLRIAADEVLAVGAIGVELSDEHAIVEVEDGCVGAWLSSAAFDRIASRTEWPIPKERPALAQGLVAGVPAKLWLPDDAPALLVTAAAHAAELSSRLR
jgi:hypothetical protein